MTLLCRLRRLAYLATSLSLSLTFFASLVPYFSRRLLMPSSLAKMEIATKEPKNPIAQVRICRAMSLFFWRPLRDEWRYFR